MFLVVDRDERRRRLLAAALELEQAEAGEAGQSGQPGEPEAERGEPEAEAGLNQQALMLSPRAARRFGIRPRG